MSKKQRAFRDCSIIIFLNIVYWLCDYYPKHIFSLDSIRDDGFSFIANSIYYIVFYSTVVRIFSSNISSQNCSETKKTFFEYKKIFALFAIQVFVDLFIALLEYCSDIWSNFLISAICALQWYIIYAVVNGIKNKKVFLKMLIFMLIILIVSISFEIAFVWQERDLSVKYTINSANILQGTYNIDFIRGIKNLFVDTICGCVLDIFHLCKISKNKESEEKNKSKAFWITAIALYFILFIASSSFVCLKILIFPTNSFAGFNVEQHLNDKNPENVEYFANTHDISINRWSKENGHYKKTACFQKNITNIYYGSEKVLSFSEDIASPAYSYELIDGVIVIDDKFDELSVKGNSVWLYDGKVICFFDGVQSHTVDLRNIDVSEENELVTEILKYLISDGNIMAFEYGGKYLHKYESDFIIPYIERYANGEFNDDEKEWMATAYYREDYIVNLAQYHLH